MELKRDDIIKALDILERFDFFQGQRAGRELWNEKPFDVQEQDIAKFSQDVAWLKNYIKELTEENEKLTINMNAYGLTAKNLGEDNERLRAEVSVKKKLLDKCIDLEDKVRADTVRKMQERLTLEFDRFHKSNFMTPEVRQWIINQIAKEMLEEGRGYEGHV